MHRWIGTLCASMVVATLLTTSTFSQNPAANPLKGAWRLAEVVEGPGAPNTMPFPSLYLFTDKHYSLMIILGPRPKFSPGQGTDADKIATFDGFAGNSGTYEVNGNTVTLHAMIGKNEYIVGTTQRAEFRIEGNTLFWTTMAGGAKSVQKLIRLE